MRRTTRVRQGVVRWLAVSVMLFVFACGALASSHGGGLLLMDAPKPIPGHPGAALDDLATQSWAWTVEHEGLVADVLGDPYTTLQDIEVGYRVHGDITAIEGSLVGDTSRDSPRPIFNTGVRLFELVFDPPLGLSDGGQLQRVRPAFLDWATNGTTGFSGQTGITFSAAVTHPGNGTTSPSMNGTHGGEIFILDWHVSFREKVGSLVHGRGAEHRSPAAAQTTYAFGLPADRLSEEGKDRLANTSVRFAFLFDYGGSATGRLHHSDNRSEPSGIYLYRGDAAAVLGFQDDEGTLDLRANGTAGGRAPTNATTTLLAPLALDAILPIGSSSRNDTASTTILHGDFGYLMDLPEPSTSPSPHDGHGEGIPPAGPPLLLLGLLLLAVVLRRTEAPT